jgi:ribokinase
VKNIAVVGSYNTGLIINTNRFPRVGETVTGKGFRETPGGKGSNQAIAASRLGAEVGIIASIGKDKFGDDAISLWKRERVKYDCVKRTDTHTGVGFVIVSSGGENMIVIDPGANMELSPQDIQKSSSLIEEASVLLIQLEIPVETVFSAARLAKKKDVTVILNPAPAQKIGRDLLSLVDVLTPNRLEFEMLTGETDLEAGCEKIQRAGTKNIVVTLGEGGCFFYSGRRKKYLKTARVKVEDTTGAGDAFNGALAVALSEGKDWEDALLFSNAAGTFCVTKREVIPALPTRKELDVFISRRMRHIRPSLNNL